MPDILWRATLMAHMNRWPALVVLLALVLAAACGQSTPTPTPTPTSTATSTPKPTATPTPTPDSGPGASCQDRLALSLSFEGVTEDAVVTSYRCDSPLCGLHGPIPGGVPKHFYYSYKVTYSPFLLPLPAPQVCFPSGNTFTDSGQAVRYRCRGRSSSERT